MEENLHYLHVYPFPKSLKLEDKTEFLVSFGAVSVLEVSQRSKKQALVAGFRSQEDRNFAVSQLNQITLLGSPLHASIWCKDRKVSEQQKLRLAAPEQDLSQLEKYEAQLTAISSHLGLSQSLPPHLKYKYPAPTATCLANIANAMVAVPKFYTQVCHLMNKMNLPPPFGAPANYTKEVLKAMVITENLLTSQADVRLQDCQERIHSNNNINDSRVLRERNVKRSVAVTDGHDNSGQILQSGSSDVSDALLDNSKDDSNVVPVPDPKQEFVKRIVGAGSGRKDVPCDETELICAACKRSFERVDLGTEKPNSPASEPVHNDNFKTTNVSESSESELESDPELSVSSVSPNTLEKLKALKRPRTTKNVPLDSRKRAKLQLKTENMLQNSDAPSSGKNSSANSKHNIRDSFKELKDLSHSKKLQLKIPDSLPRKKTNIGKSVSLIVMESQTTSGRAGPAQCTSQAALSESVETLTSHSDRSTAGQLGVGDGSASVDLDATTTMSAGGGNDEALPSFGKIQVKPSEKKPVRSRENFISLEELENNRIKESEYPVVPVLAKYSPGEPSSRLYIKNLAKSASVGHLQRIYDRFVVDFFRAAVAPCREEDGPVDIRADQTKYNIRVMQEGRMKGQAFVTLPSVAVADEARRLTNGYILLDKPMVVSFARVKPAQ